MPVVMFSNHICEFNSFQLYELKSFFKKNVEKMVSVRLVDVKETFIVGASEKSKTYPFLITQPKFNDKY